MKKITRIWQLMLVALLISSVGFAQSYSVADVIAKQKKVEQLKMEKIHKVVGAMKNITPKKDRGKFKEGSLRGGVRSIALDALSYGTKGADCPAGSVWGLPLTGFTNAATSDVDPGYKVYQKVSGSYNVTDIHWWGIKFFHNGSNWAACSEDPVAFVVEVHDDNAGAPGAVVATFSATIAGVDSGETFAGEPIYEYTISLGATPYTINDGQWISIFGDPGNDPNCWFLWVNSGTAATFMQQEVVAQGTFTENPYSMAMCLIGSFAYNDDLAVTDVTSPVDGVLTATESVTIEITNFGANDQTNFPVSFTFDGTTYNENYVGTLASGASDLFTFSQTIDCSVVGNYSLVACADLATDQNVSNDCFTHNFECLAPGYCDASGGCDEFIDGVEIGSISNLASGCGNYQDWTALSTDLAQGTTVSITVTNGNPYSSDDLGVWIDWNQDLDFDDAGENVVCEADNGGQGTFSFAVPATAALGNTTMRIRIKWSGADCGAPCGATTYGEVEDYTVNVTPPPTCPPPTALTTTDITTNSAKLNWSSAGSLFEYEYGAPGFAPGTGAEIGSGGTHNLYVDISGLSSATDYDWYVRADCGGGSYSDWVGSSFTTLCDVIVAPYSEDFTGADFPACWSQSSELGSENWVVSATTNAGGTANEMRNSWQSGTGITRLISPELDLTGLTTPYLSFNHFFNDYGAGITAKIQTSTDGGATWVDEAWSIASGNGNVGPETVTLSLTNTGSSTLIAWVMDGDHYQFDYWYVDDVEVMDAPTCPDPTGLSVDNVSYNSADLLWTSNSGSSNIEYGLAGFTLGVDPIGTGSGVTSPFPVSGLSASTDYDFYVQDDCGNGDVSSWVGPFTFTTTPTNDDCANAEAVTGPYPVAVSGTTYGATVDCPGVLDWDAVWYAIDLPYPTNQVTINLCLDDAGATLNNTGIILVPDCNVCGNFIYTDGTWSASGNCISNMVFEVEGPGTVYYPVMTDPKGAFTFDVDVVSIPTILGNLKYANAASTDLDHSVAHLTDAASTTYDYSTMCDGSFRFAGYPDGDYELTGTTDKPWGGLSIVDAILTQRFLAGLYSLTPLQQLAADVTESGSPGVVDVIMLKRRITGLTYPAWNAPDFVFESHTVTLAGADVSQDVFALCSGDVNGSYTPPATCPTPTNLGAVKVSDTEYNLVWDGVGSSSDLEWGPAGFTPGTGTLVTGVTSPYNLTGLTPDNSYDFYVRDYCCSGSTPSDWAGPFTFPPPPPANDDCSTAEAIGEVTDYPFSTTSATTSGLDTHSVNQDIWYAYTPAADGTIDVDLCGSGFDTKLVIYDGSCGSLNELGYNDDDCGLQSAISGIAVTAGTTYLIQVGGYGSSSGDGDITITFY